MNKQVRRKVNPSKEAALSLGDPTANKKMSERLVSHQLSELHLHEIAILIGGALATMTMLYTQIFWPPGFYIDEKTEIFGGVYFAQFIKVTNRTGQPIFDVHQIGIDPLVDGKNWQNLGCGFTSDEPGEDPMMQQSTLMSAPKLPPELAKQQPLTEIAKVRGYKSLPTDRSVSTACIWFFKSIPIGKIQEQPQGVLVETETLEKALEVFKLTTYSSNIGRAKARAWYQQSDKSKAQILSIVTGIGLTLIFVLLYFVFRRRLTQATQ